LLSLSISFIFSDIYIYLHLRQCDRPCRPHVPPKCRICWSAQSRPARVNYPSKLPSPHDRTYLGPGWACSWFETRTAIPPWCRPLTAKEISVYRSIPRELSRVMLNRWFKCAMKRGSFKVARFCIVPEIPGISPDEGDRALVARENGEPDPSSYLDRDSLKPLRAETQVAVSLPTTSDKRCIVARCVNFPWGPSALPREDLAFYRNYKRREYAKFCAWSKDKQMNVTKNSVSREDKRSHRRFLFSRAYLLEPCIISVDLHSRKLLIALYSTFQDNTDATIKSRMFGWHWRIKPLVHPIYQ